MVRQIRVRTKTGGSMARTRKRRRPKNLLLDAEALDRGEQYCERSETSLSRLVEDYLHSLPRRWPFDATSLIVRRLRGAIAFAEPGPDPYRDYVYGMHIEGDHADRLK